MAITAVSSAALALLDAAVEPMPVHSIYRSGVNLRCGDYLIHASTQPHGGVSSIGLTARDVDLICRQPAWEWTADRLVTHDRRTAILMDHEVERYPTCPPPAPNLSAATSGRLETARASTGRRSWFDSDLGRTVGLPKLRAAIHAVVSHQPDAGARLRAAVGLGTGLTPSADDALVGALCLLCADGTFGADLRDELRAWLRAEGVDSTTDVSLSYLRLAVEGAFSGPVNRVVSALSEGSSQAELEESVRDLGALGATSGMDIAMGIQLACQCLTHPRTDPDRS